ncbi:MAG TPA: alpha-amylase/4-alpha-glucanotransferase domain-containing protein, partial [Candidatus Binatia bacterium]|nr:alpha-amylase/4-alpha-glucanotransferase domain-containing protein [Candidatus Binatia bacterium]
MASRLALALVLHNHQPVGNFGWVIEDVHRTAYEPMLAALERHPRIRLGLHYSGPLLDWLSAERPDFLARLHDLAAHDRVELLGGGYTEPILPALPHRDRLCQLRRMAVEVERIGGRRPRGAWLAERVWEPDLPASLVDGGYEWTVLDDEHFRAASVDETALWGAYETEDQGRRLAVFGTDKELRYRIPYGEVETTLAYLRGLADEAPRLATMGDDGEKFGSWPDTYAHCWGSDGESGWVDRFFTALEAERGWLRLATPSEWLDRERPLGRVYIPTASYTEMGGWALPADEGAVFERTLAAARAAGLPEARWLRGGFWRGFQVKYREINDLHKQMLRASAKVDAMAAGGERDAAILELHQGQGNDCYWHGVFGGIYISHMRLATYEHLIAAEDLADAAARVTAAGGRTPGPDGIVATDTDFDGIDELLITSPGQVVVIDPAEGAGIGSWDIRAVRHALTAVLRRRPEAYHQALIEHESAATVEAAGASLDGPYDAPATIHDVVREREPGLAARLHYDRHERRSGLVHLFAPGTTAKGWAEAEAIELGDAHTGAYEAIEIGPERVVLRRDVAIPDFGATIRVEKRFTFRGDRREPGVGLEVAVEHRAGPSLEAELGIEWALTMLGGGGNPAAYYEAGGRTSLHDGTGEAANATRVLSGNRYVGIELETTVEPAGTIRWTPIETISNSEAGFERTYQGSALIAVWPVRLAPGARAAVTVDQQVTTDRDRAENPSA